ncbi:MAG: TetR/AcrR family transcriptional regulator [Phycisphaerales bacterium]
MKPVLRDHILKTAAVLFETRGYNATGVDLIVQRSGVAKRTLYTYFGSKDAVIIAVLRMRLEEQMAWLRRELQDRAADPRGRILAIFGAMIDSAEEHGWTSCPFIAAAAEFPLDPAPIRNAIKEEHDAVLGLILELCIRGGAPDPESLAHELSMMRRGAMATAMAAGDPVPVFAAARAAADRLLEVHGLARRNSGLHLMG